MRPSLRFPVTLASLATIVGALVGLVRGTAFVRANGYRDVGLEWLARDAWATRFAEGTLAGLVVGIGVALLAAFVLRGGLRRFLSWVRARVLVLDVLDRDRLVGLGLALLATGLLLYFGLQILNERFIPWDYTRRYWVLNGGWIVACVVGLVILYNLLRLPRYDDRFARRAAGATGIAALLVVATAAAGWGWRLVTRPEPAAGARTIILITVDTQRADHLSCYGYPRETSPKLDALAAKGILFENAFSHAPVTSSSFSCIHTGLRPRETGTYGNDPLRLGMHTVAEQLREAGYVTGAVVSNFVLQRGKNYEFGFDHYDDRMSSRELVRRTPERIGEHTTDAALAWLESVRSDGAGSPGEERPVFLWVHYQDPHGPYTPPREYQMRFLDESARGRPLRVADSVKGQDGIPSYQVLGANREYGYYVAQYDAEIAYFDDALDRLVQGLRRVGLWDESLVLFTSDHGEGMGEHDYYFAHGDYLWPGQTHVPLIVWPPRAAGRREARVVQSADVAPTILSFAGIAPTRPLPGLDLLGPLADGPERWVLSETFVSDNYKAALRSEDLMVFFDAFNGDFRAYVPAEGRFLTEGETFDHPDFEPMKAKLDELRNPRATRSAGTADRQEMEILKSLGYVN